MTISQYMRYRNIEEIKKTLIILDNTSDKLVEILPGQLAFLNKNGEVRLINMKTLEEINEEPMQTLGVINSSILISKVSKVLDGNDHSILVDLDNFNKLIDTRKKLNICGDIIYTSESGIITKDPKEFEVYNFKGERMYKSYIGYTVDVLKLSKSDVYAVSYTTTAQTDSKYESYKHTVLLKHNKLINACTEIATLHKDLKFQIVSEDSIVVTRLEHGNNVASNVLDVNQLYKNSTKELDKIIYL